MFGVHVVCTVLHTYSVQKEKGKLEKEPRLKDIQCLVSGPPLILHHAAVKKPVDHYSHADSVGCAGKLACG